MTQPAARSESSRGAGGFMNKVLASLWGDSQNPEALFRALKAVDSRLSRRDLEVTRTTRRSAEPARSRIDTASDKSTEQSSWQPPDRLAFDPRSTNEKPEWLKGHGRSTHGHEQRLFSPVERAAAQSRNDELRGALSDLARLVRNSPEISAKMEQLLASKSGAVKRPQDFYPLASGSRSRSSAVNPYAP